MKSANECGVPMAIGPISSDGKKGFSNFYMKSDFVKQLRILGSAQIVLGVISIIAHAINMAIYWSFHLRGLPQVGYGFWNGAIFVLTGMLGVVSGLQRYRFTTVLFGCMSILSACLTVALFTLAIVSAALCGINEHWVNGYMNGGSSNYAYGSPEHPDAQRAAIAMEMIMAVVAIVEAFVAIRSILTVRKTGISCRDGCYQSDKISSQPFLKFQVGSCVCHCVGSCYLPSYPGFDELATPWMHCAFIFKSSSTDHDPEQSLVEGLLSLRDESDEKQSTMMDVRHPLYFYSGTVDQKQQIGPLDQKQLDEDSSDRSKLIEK